MSLACQMANRGSGHIVFVQDLAVPDVSLERPTINKRVHVSNQLQIGHKIVSEWSECQNRLFALVCRAGDGVPYWKACAVTKNNRASGLLQHRRHQPIDLIHVADGLLQSVPEVDTAVCCTGPSVLRNSVLHSGVRFAEGTISHNAGTLQMQWPHLQELQQAIASLRNDHCRPPHGFLPTHT